MTRKIFTRVLFTTAAALSLATATTRPAFAGAVGGPESGSSNVNANATDRYQIAFRAGEEAVVRIHGDGDTTLVARVYDGDGNLITVDSDADGTGYVLLRWTPRWTGTFTIRLQNTGGVYNHYTMVTN
jgi:hypothetical protein